MTEFRMPSLGADMEHGKVVEWLVRPGDYVRKGDLIAAVDTDKTVMDIESFEEGVVAEFLVEIGDTVDVGTPIARITATPAQLPSERPPRDQAAKLPPPVRHLAHSLGVDVGSLHGSGRNAEVTRADVERAGAASLTKAAVLPPPPRRPHPAPPGAAGGGRVRSSPLARRLAERLGVDLKGLAGTGPGGAVTEADVRREASGGPRKEAPGGKAESLRQAVGALMSRSKKEIPHYYLATTLDLAAAMAWMASANQERPVASRLVPSALLLKATALAAKEVPEMNGFFADGSFRPGTAVHLGVAVALRQGGLVAPALHDADALTLDELMEQLRGLVARARAGRLQRAEMADPTITVTNLGDLGVESVYGVIYPPQVAMVGFGRVTEQPWAHHGMLGIRHAATATLSADHRVSNGLRGGRFLSRIDELLQTPEEL
ncbi:dihydrolipoamide acetyltransferase family protein [Pseudarthrobacter sp. NPDC092439]|uniref:dihydrolipoamide acetyltransferase family protein n=1 Tax=unclassified Pseudarthrobacter TaxID=2647000 RepID=UPI0037F2F990